MLRIVLLIEDNIYISSLPVPLLSSTALLALLSVLVFFSLLSLMVILISPYILGVVGWCDGAG